MGVLPIASLTTLSAFKHTPVSPTGAVTACERIKDFPKPSGGMVPKCVRRARPASQNRYAAKYAAYLFCDDKIIKASASGAILLANSQCY